jgi:hypothetical protein
LASETNIDSNTEQKKKRGEASMPLPKYLVFDTSNNGWSAGLINNSGASQSSWSTINSTIQFSQPNQISSQSIQNVQINSQPVIYTQPSKTVTVTQINKNQANQKQFYS